MMSKALNPRWPPSVMENMFHVNSRSRSCKKVKVKVIFDWFQVESHAVMSKQRSPYDEH